MTEIKNMSFEDAMKELEATVGKLEHGDATLEESISLYERGAALKARCETLLKAADDKVEKIRLGADGAPSGTEPLDP